MILLNDLNLNGNFRRQHRWLGLALGAALMAGAGTSSVQADQVTTAPNFGPYHAAAGEFTMLPDAGVTAMLGAYSPYTMNYVQTGSFQTFCVERDEFITPNTTFDVTSNQVTTFSGIPLSAGAAYLYQQFATGNLAYNYADAPTGARTTVGFADAWMLQNALWFLMGELSGQENNPYVLQADNALGGIRATFAPDNGAHNVSVLNLWAPNQPHDPQHSYQDVLIYNAVPEPSTAALLSLAALFTLRRKH